MKKHIPNILSIFRLLLSISLPAWISSATAFFICYLLCGISDVADGVLARRWRVTSTFGARIDSAADTVFFLALPVCLYLWNPVLFGQLAVPLFLLVVTRGMSLVIARMRFGRLASLHTYANKLAGALLFAAPVLTLLPSAEIWLFVLLAFSMLASAEEIVLLLTMPRLDLNRKSVFKGG